GQTRETRDMKALTMFAATAISVTPAAPAFAQDHAGHGDHAAMPASAPAEAIDHSAMGHAMPEGPAEASGTARLPQAEGMMPGLHFDLGSGWSGMVHGHAWGV